MRDIGTKITMLATLALCASMAHGQTIGELCDPQYAAADEGFANTFCNRTPEQMRRQLNKMFAANRMLFNPNAVALTPRESDQRWVEFPRPEGWSLYIDRGVGYGHDPYWQSLRERTSLISIFYFRRSWSDRGQTERLYLHIHTGTSAFVGFHAFFQGEQSSLGCIEMDSPHINTAERYVLHRYEQAPAYDMRNGFKESGGVCAEGTTTPLRDDWSLRLAMGTINRHIVEDVPWRQQPGLGGDRQLPTPIFRYESGGLGWSTECGATHGVWVVWPDPHNGAERYELEVVQIHPDRPAWENITVREFGEGDSDVPADDDVTPTTILNGHWRLRVRYIGEGWEPSEWSNPVYHDFSDNGCG